MIKKSINKVFIILVLSIFIITSFTQVFADVGSFDRYDSGSSFSSGSSFDFGSSYDDYGSDYDYSYGGYSGGVVFGGGIWALIIIIIIIIIISKARNGHNYMPRVPRNQVRNNTYLGDDTEKVSNQIKQIDPMFSAEDFLAWSKEVFIKLQNAWTKRDWSVIRPFETNELFEQHKSQLQEFIDNDKINVMERISVPYAELHEFRQEGDKEFLTITLKSIMVDYIIDAKTKEVLQGNKYEDRHMTYRMTFVRTAGVKTPKGTKELNTTNCPNCGAPTQITSAGKCEYCGSIITTDDHGWVLSNLEGLK